MKTVDIPMGSNCAPVLADFLFWYEADFMQTYLQKNENKLTRPLNCTFPYEADVLSLVSEWIFTKEKDVSLPKTKYLYLR
jgi:hypothetical protein